MAHFTRVGLQIVQSNEGYEVELTGPYTLQYRESGGRRATLYAPEVISFADKVSRRIHLRHHLAWESHGTILTDRDRKLVKRRIHAALKFMDEPHEFR